MTAASRFFANLGMACAVATLSVMSSSGQLLKWAGNTGLAVYAVLILILALLTANQRILDTLWKSRTWAAVILTGACLFLVLLFLFVYPIAHSGRFGPGTDRDEGFNLALGALLHGHYPYYLKTRFHVPITPMPGALLLALPFYLLGNAAYQDLFWISVFAYFCWRFFPTPKQSLLFFGIFLCANLSFLQDYVTGGDYAVNLICVTMAAAFFGERVKLGAPFQALLLPAFLLGLAMAWRPIYFAVLPVLFFYGCKRADTRTNFIACALALLVSTALTGPFYLYDPAGFSPLHIVRFATPIVPHATIVLPVLALASTFAAIWLPLDRYRIFGLLAIAMGFIFLPEVIASIGHFSPAAVDLLDYSYPVTFFAGLWLSSLDRFKPEHAVTPA